MVEIGSLGIVNDHRYLSSKHVKSSTTSGRNDYVGGHSWIVMGKSPSHSHRGGHGFKSRQLHHRFHLVLAGGIVDWPEPPTIPERFTLEWSGQVSGC